MDYEKYGLKGVQRLAKLAIDIRNHWHGMKILVSP